jgi:hypothetical protein
MKKKQRKKLDCNNYLQRVAFNKFHDDGMTIRIHRFRNWKATLMQGLRKKHCESTVRSTKQADITFVEVTENTHTSKSQIRLPSICKKNKQQQQRI